jgi:hypothetical protein
MQAENPGYTQLVLPGRPSGVLTEPLQPKLQPNEPT